MRWLGVIPTPMALGLPGSGMTHHRGMDSSYNMLLRSRHTGWFYLSRDKRGSDLKRKKKKEPNIENNIEKKGKISYSSV
jgi:hypothetical protein